MGKILVVIFLLIGQVSVFVQPVTAGASAAASRAINELVSVEVMGGEHTSQVVFRFDHSLYYEKKERSPGEQITLYFPGVKIDTFNKLGVMGQIRRLSIVKNVSITYERTPINRVAVTIDFAKDSVLLRLTKMDEPKLLIIDIFDKKVLESIRKKVTTTLYACNDKVLPGLHAAKKKKSPSPRKAHIVIDAGHGGLDSGASSFGLQEKNFTLDIARRVCASLRKEGYRVFLTRNADNYLSVDDRVQLARQLKADLFVSVHVNAVASLKDVSGVETYFFDGAPYFNEQRKQKVFMFVHDAYDKCLARVADKILHKKLTDSRKLSSFIHQGVLDHLTNKKIEVVNRGVKKANFGVLLRNEAPASLVEVGFLTNKKEAKRLTQPVYRGWLSQGICNGIKQFLFEHGSVRTMRGG
ncbi:N-acetylmuramoyl-L-alanine amidase [Candidatus Dependentiae bacterium]|nr:N-acetylmuramoyl-L-alanine amidase [Candidatus Dependentiae bacterium]